MILASQLEAAGKALPDSRAMDDAEQALVASQGGNQDKRGGKIATASTSSMASAASVASTPARLLRRSSDAARQTHQRNTSSQPSGGGGGNGGGGGGGGSTLVAGHTVGSTLRRLKRPSPLAVAGTDAGCSVRYVDLTTHLHEEMAR